MSGFISNNKPIIMLLQHEDSVIEKLRKAVGDEALFLEMTDANEVISWSLNHPEKPAIVAINVSTPRLNEIDKINDFTRSENGLPIPIIAFSNTYDEDIACMLFERSVADYIGFDRVRKPDISRLRNYIKDYVFIKKKELLKEESDELTGALNYIGLKRHFESLTNAMPSEVLVVVYADISNFKYFNYVFSFDEGNRLLKFWHETIRQHVSELDLVCRMSSDHFVIVMTTGEDDSAGVRDFDLILKEIRAHFAKDFTDYTIDITSGIYIYNPMLNRNETLDEIIGYARHAQSIAKVSGGSGLKLFDDEMWTKEKRYLELNGHLRQAIKDGELFLYLQPQYHIITGELIGAECLCRWNHSLYGMLSPGEFIPALEKSGSIVLLDLFVWEEACKLTKKWQDSGKVITLSVNVSRKDILSIDVPGTFGYLVKKYKISPGQIRIEITESAFVDDIEGICSIVNRLHALGFSVDMDDFGSGYSSLNFLHTIDVDLIKLDMGFLDNKTQTAKSGGILNAMIKMAHVLGIGVLAEGVENAEQADELKNLGCLMGQGYYFAKPMPVIDFEVLIKSDRVYMIKDSETYKQNFKINELFDRSSSGYHLFNKFLGPALIFNDDGESYKPVLINDEFVDLVRITRDEIEKNRINIFFSIDAKFQADIRNMVSEAKNKGFSKAEIASETSGRVFFIEIKLISTRTKEDLYFCEARDVTEEKKNSLENRWYEQKLKAILEIPGVIVYEYNPIDDEMVITLRDSSGNFKRLSDKPYLAHLKEQNWVLEDYVDSYIKTIKNVVETGNYDSVLAKVRFKGGEYHLVRYYFSAVTDDNDKVYRVIGRAEQVDDETADVLVNDIPMGTFRYRTDDAEMEFDFIGKNLYLMFGFNNEESFRRNYKNTFKRFVHPDDMRNVINIIDEQQKSGANKFLEYRVIDANGDDRWVYERRTQVSDENGTLWWYVAITDLNDYKNEQIKSKSEVDELLQKYKTTSRHDSMTELYNHAYTIKLIHRYVSIKNEGILFVIDIDNFKNINDTMGHLYGDRVICEFADVLKTVFGANDVVGRYGGDEFVCFIPFTNSKKIAAERAKQIIELASKIKISDTDYLSISIGIAMGKGADGDARTLIDYADKAMLKVKNTGKGDFVFSE